MDHERRMHVVEGARFDEHSLPRRITACRRVGKANQFLSRRAEHRDPQANVVEWIAKAGRRRDRSASNDVVTAGMYV
jgi:hypothetical protein